MIMDGDQQSTSKIQTAMFLQLDKSPRRIVLWGRLYHDEDYQQIGRIVVTGSPEEPFKVEANGKKTKNYKTKDHAIGYLAMLAADLIEDMEVPYAENYQDSQLSDIHRGRI